jgi:tetratricopeptide (TPR) repeat protein
MTHTMDARGLDVSGATPRALAHYERAIALFLCHRGDPLAAARAAREEAPAFVAARQLEAWLLLCSRDRRDMAAARAAHRAARRLPMNLRERGHAAALNAILARDIAGLMRHLETIEALAPLDVVAFTVANTYDLFLGDTAAPARRTARAFARWAPGMPGYHAILSMHAFALEERGEYGRAEEAARCALEDEPLDLRAHHAVAHVHEMRGQPDAGIRWMGERAAFWNEPGRASTHHWWHLALFHLQRGDPVHALRIYDRRIASTRTLAGLIDASALLWRLELDGAAPGARWQALAEAWAPRATDANCAFNDVHAMMAFAGAGRGDLAAALLSAQAQLAARPGPLGAMARLTGAPACRALLAYGQGDYAGAERMLRALPPVAHRIGGSQAQRDVLELTRHRASAILHRARALQSFSATSPASTSAAPASRSTRRPSLRNQAPISAAKITEVSRSAATIATGARVIAQSAMP